MTSTPERPHSPAVDFDLLIDELKKDVDRTLIRENLKLMPGERLRQLMKLQEFAEELQKAGEGVWARR